jgi:hypothetical protein
MAAKLGPSKRRMMGDILAEMKFLRKSAGCILLIHKRNALITEETK